MINIYPVKYPFLCVENLQRNIFAIANTKRLLSVALFSTQETLNVFLQPQYARHIIYYPCFYSVNPH